MLSKYLGRIPLLLCLIVSSSCGQDSLADHDEIFVSPADHGVLCAALADDPHYQLEEITPAFDRARDRNEIVQVFFHDPGVTVSPDKIEAVLAAADARGLRYVSYRDIAMGAMSGPGVALSFDDYYVAEWVTILPILARHHALVTFFVSDYNAFNEQSKSELRQLADAGHDIEYHSTLHQDAPKFVREKGMSEYLAFDIDPALGDMRRDGYDPIVFAYPLGRHTPELDAVLLNRFALLRSTTIECGR